MQPSQDGHRGELPRYAIQFRSYKTETYRKKQVQRVLEESNPEIQPSPGHTKEKPIDATQLRQS